METVIKKIAFGCQNKGTESSQIEQQSKQNSVESGEVRVWHAGCRIVDGAGAERDEENREGGVKLSGSQTCQVPARQRGRWDTLRRWN